MAALLGGLVFVALLTTWHVRSVLRSPHPDCGPVVSGEELVPSGEQPEITAPAPTTSIPAKKRVMGGT